MKCKKELMGLAAILILIFHFWMPLTASLVEANIYKSTYMGVDIFFFLSAYSLAKRRQGSYWDFIKNRILNIYVPFFVMAVICAIYKGWSFLLLIKVVSGVDFFIRGGGSFLWFAIAIMILYLITPFLSRIKAKLGLFAIPLLIILWLALACILQFVFGYTAIFILLNRIPIFVLGFFYQDICDSLSKMNNAKKENIYDKLRVGMCLFGLLFGGYLVFRFCGNIRLSKPIVDFYYILVIPFIVAFITLVDYISIKKSINFRPLAFIGTFTLELYGMQMIFGINIETKLYKLLSKTALFLQMSKLLAFIFTAIILMLIAWLFSYAKRMIYKYLAERSRI